MICVVQRSPKRVGSSICTNNNDLSKSSLAQNYDAVKRRRGTSIIIVVFVTRCYLVGATYSHNGMQREEIFKQTTGQRSSSIEFHEKKTHS